MYLYGASGHAKVIVDILRAINEPIEALFDDNEAIHRLLDYPVLRSVEVKGPLIISIGNNNIRKKIAEQFNVRFGKAFHPSAIISATTAIDEGTVVMQGAIIQTGVYVGKHCIINTGASVDHECVIEGLKLLMIWYINISVGIFVTIISIIIISSHIKNKVIRCQHLIELFT